MSFFNNMVVDFFKSLFTDFLEFSFKLVTDLLLNLNALDQYFDYSKFLFYIQILAGSILTILVFYQAFKRLSGSLIFDGDSKSMSTIMLQTVFSGALIYLLPYVLTNILIPLNNIAIGLFSSLGFPIKQANLSGIVWNFLDASLLNGTVTPMSILLMIVIFLIGFIILGVMSGIRYIELIVALLISPLVAIQFVNNQSAIGVWFKEVISLVFTQSVHIVLLQFLISSLSISNPFVAIILFVGIVSVMAKGPKIIRQFMYSSGAGSTLIGATGGMGRMVAMKYMLGK